jgi:hypothetical protein
MSTKLSPYFGTLTEAVNSLQLVLDAAQADMMDSCATWEGPAWHEELTREPVNYGTTLRKSFEIFTLKGRQTRKFFHVVIYRTEGGLYEVTSYIL